MYFTIKKTARLAGVTAKTLRHYEKIGLLTPTARSTSGYRLYTDPDLDRLRQILLFRELGFPLKRITEVMKAPAADRRQWLQMQAASLEDSACHYSRLARLAQRTLEDIYSDPPDLTNNAVPAPVNRNKTAVVVVDVQNDFFSGALANNRAERIVGPLQELLQRSRQRGVPVIYVCDSHLDEPHDEFPIWGVHALSGTAGAEIIPQLKPAAGDHILYKRYYSALDRTDLNDLLLKLNVGTIVIAGLHAHLCVRQTIEDAHKWGYKVIVPHDCTEAFSADDHESALRCLRQGFNSAIFSSAEIISHPDWL